MRRKVNRVGQNTLTVSLPTKWVRQHSIEKGDELYFQDHPHGLLLTPEPKPSTAQVEINLSGFGSMVNRTICATYKAGYSAVNFRYSTAEELNTIQNTLARSCHVFEIMEIKDNRVEVKQISELDRNDFDGILRKMGFALTNMAHETLTAVKDNYVNLLQTAILKDRIVDRHSDFCRRLINRGHNAGYARPAPLYTIVEVSEILADVYKSLCQDVLAGHSAEKDTIQLLADVNAMVAHFYNAFNEFTFEKIAELGRLEVAIRKTYDAMCPKK